MGAQEGCGIAIYEYKESERRNKDMMDLSSVRWCLLTIFQGLCQIGQKIERILVDQFWLFLLYPVRAIWNIAHL